MAKIKITDRMAEAMAAAEDDDCLDPVYPRCGSGTVCALINRGLVKADRNGRHPFTAAGRIVRASLHVDADRRTWTAEELVPQPETDVDAGRLTLEQALAEAHTDWRMGEPAVVKIGYVDGTTEEIRNIPRGEIAVAIYAEAVDNDRVASAELIRGDGTQAALYPARESLSRDVVVPWECGRHMGEDVARAYGRKSLAACARMPGHLGRHRSTRNITVLTLHWTDEQCVPLDH